jgi:hypothetical protein
VVYRCSFLGVHPAAKAFRGELVPTEAELARRGGRAYEPASVLLERIRSERVHEPKRAGGKRARRGIVARQRRATRCAGTDNVTGKSKT